ncbi:Cytochrome c biogenesis protein CcdA, partial [Arthrobacter subterraneus]
LGGLLTLLSPCSALLLPAFFAYAFTTPAQLVARTGLFYLGLLSTLVPLGVFAGALGSLVTQHRSVLIAVASALVISVGIAQLVGIRLPPLFRSAHQGEGPRLSVFVLGSVYGVAGACTGPILGSVLTVAAVGSNAVYGGVLLAVYALGMALPLFVLALLWDRLGVSGRSWLRPRQVRVGRWSNSVVMVISGGLSIGIGVLLLVTDGTAGLGGVLTVSDQFRLESAASGIASGVSNPVFMVAAVAVLTLTSALRWRTRRESRHADTERKRSAVQEEKDVR